MANDDYIGARGGLLPLTQPYGAVKKTWYKLTTGGATVNIFLGMPVDRDNTGGVVPITVGSNNLTIGPVLGFADTLEASIPTALASLTQGAYLPGNTDAYVLVADDPDQEFIIQENTGGTALTASEAGNSCWVNYRSSSGSTVTGYTTLELQRANVGTGTDGLVMLIRAADNINADGTTNAPGNYAKWVVRILNHRYANAKFGTPV